MLLLDCHGGILWIFNFEDLFNNISDNNKNKSAENDPLKIYGRNLTDLAD
nr:hypothetical protein [Mycoplasmopsis bovis]